MPLLDILQEAVRREASDVLVIAGLPVSYKVHGRIDRVGERLLPDATGALTEELYALAKRPMDHLLETGDDDFSFAVPGLSRFRVNALRQRGSRTSFFTPVRLIFFKFHVSRLCHLSSSGYLDPFHRIKICVWFVNRHTDPIVISQRREFQASLCDNPQTASEVFVF